MNDNKKPTKCISVRLKTFFHVSDKCYLAIAFDGTKDTIPASGYFGQDTETTKSKAYWIAEWVLKTKSLQHQTKDPKIAWFDGNRNRCAAPETKPRRTPRRTRFTVTYTNKRTSEKYKSIVVADNEEAARNSVMSKFSSEDIEIISIETRPGRNKPNSANAK